MGRIVQFVGSALLMLVVIADITITMLMIKAWTELQNIHWWNFCFVKSLMKIFVALLEHCQISRVWNLAFLAVKVTKTSFIRIKRLCC